MNQCEFCEEKFNYWKVWRSYWRYRLECPSCSKRNVVELNRRFFPTFVIVGLPFLVAGQIYRYFDVLTIFSYVAIYFSVVLLLSLLVPLFKLYGE